MQEFRKPHSTKRIHYGVRFCATLCTTFALFAVACFAVSAAWGMYGTFKVAAAGRDQTQLQLASAEHDEARVTATVEAFNSPSGIDAEARERFGLALPDEGEIDVVQSAVGAAPAAPAEKGNAVLRTLQSLFSW